MRIYLDTNVFYHAYCPIEEDTSTEWLLEKFTQHFQGVTSEWTIIEMFRALKKQVNLNKIEDSDAQVIIDYFLSDLGEMEEKKIINIIPITRNIIQTTRKTIFSLNLYAADALHANTALKTRSSAFITYDKDFKKYLYSLPVLNPSQKTFKKDIELLLKNSLTV